MPFEVTTGEPGQKRPTDEFQKTGRHDQVRIVCRAQPGQFRVPLVPDRAEHIAAHDVRTAGLQQVLALADVGPNGGRSFAKAATVAGSGPI